MSLSDLPPAAAALAFTDVSVVRGGRLIWSHARFTVPAGGIVAVIGPNGSGKTTLLHTVLGLIPAASGQLKVFGHHPGQDNNSIGYVPQHYAASAGEAVRATDAVLLGLTGRRWAFGRTTAAQRQQVTQALAAVEATEFADRRLSMLSGGQRQRIAIAEALVAQPQLLILDEPLASLDLRSQRDIVALLARLHAELDVTMLVVAHDLNPLLPILDSAIYLLDGHPHYAPIEDVMDDELLTLPVRHSDPGRAHARRRAVYEEQTVAAEYLALGYEPDWWPILTSGFMRNALLGGTIVALAAGLIGYFVVVRHTAFAAHALAHIGLPGATGAVLVGVPVIVGLGVFCVGGALVIGALGKRAADREVVTGTVLAMATGLGLFFNSLATQSSSTMTNVLFGNLLAISHQQLVSFAILLVVLAFSVGIIYRPLLFSSVNAVVAQAKGVPVRALSIMFMTLLGLAVTMAVQAVGTLLLFALVVTPAATAIMLTARPVLAMVISTAISLSAVWLGLGASAMFNLPPSFLIVSIACAVWSIVWVSGRARRTAAQTSEKSTGAAPTITSSTRPASATSGM